MFAQSLALLYRDETFQNQDAGLLIVGHHSGRKTAIRRGGIYR